MKLVLSLMKKKNKVIKFFNMVKRKTCVFISGRGSNLKNLILHSRDNNFPIKISLIISNNKNAYGINYAKKFQIPYIIINTKLRNCENKILLV